MLSDPINCRKCNEPFLRARRGLRYCEPCRTSCSVDGCVKAVSKGGLCAMHHERLKKHGDLGGVLSTVQPAGGPCAVQGCQETAHGAGLCNLHYKRVRRFGDDRGPDRLHARVGDRITARGYRYTRVNKKYALEHRVVMERMLGRPLKANENVHHLDGDKLNNDPSNLELWVKTQPCGQRVSDRVKAALALLREHPDVVSREGFRLVLLESQEATDLFRDEGLNLYPGTSPAVI